MKIETKESFVVVYNNNHDSLIGLSGRKVRGAIVPRIYLHTFDNIYEIKIIFSRVFFSRLSDGENKCIVLQRGCTGAPFGVDDALWGPALSPLIPY